MGHVAVIHVRPGMQTPEGQRPERLQALYQTPSVGGQPYRLVYARPGYRPPVEVINLQEQFLNPGPGWRVEHGYHILRSINLPTLILGVDTDGEA